MKAFFTCSTESIEKYAGNYRAIRDGITGLGHTINRDWIDYSINLAERDISQSPSHTFYDDVITAILTADVVVADATVQTMTLGHQVSYALQNNKPVLLLSKKDNQKKSGEKFFIEASRSKYLNICEYVSISDIHKILKNFFKKYENKPKKRLNLILSGAINNYINWASFYYKKTKTDIIHEAVEKAAERDSLYKKYLSKQS